MSLLHEISGLHSELVAARGRAQAGAPNERAQAPVPGKQSSVPAEEAGDASTQELVREIEALVNVIAKDMEQNPRMTALAAFGLGLMLGITISR